MSQVKAGQLNLMGRPGKMTGRLNAAGMTFEAFAVFFGTLAAVGLNTGHTTAAWTWGIGLTFWCFLVAGLARSPIGLVAGALTQVVLIGIATQVDLGIIVALMFAGLWVWLVWAGLKVDRDHAIIRAAQNR